MSDYLLEIGLEEIPARFITQISQQLEDLVGKYLDDNRLSYEAIQKYSTPRRLAVKVINIASKQENKSELVKGPSLKIAKDDNGEWTRAALGFLKGQNATEKDVIIQFVKDEEYIFVNKFTEGLETKEILKNISSIISSMTFPVSMRWNIFESSFIRPIHWFVSLLDDEVIPFTSFNVEAGRRSQGHRFLGEYIDIEHTNDYETALEKQYVIVDFNKRQELIREQISIIARENNWHVPIDQDLLEEVTSIVEWPTAFYGEFDQKYLELPSIISVTAMTGHQRYFHVRDSQQNLLPYFISVRNGDHNHLENVVRGNLKVLKARLEDGLFFYNEDLNRPLNHYVDKLAHVNEHFKLGTFANKQDRIQQLVSLVSADINFSDQERQDLLRAAQIYKFDLMTNVVDEFSELQGQIGEIYALNYGENETVSRAIGSQYLPNKSGGELPQGLVPSVLAMLDKLDTIYQYFMVDMIPTGSNDPYALRRQSMGIIEIIIANQWHINFEKWLYLYAQAFNPSFDEDLHNQIGEFMKARLKQLLSKLNVDHDIINATVSAKDFNMFMIYQNALELQTIKSEYPDSFRSVFEAMTRIVNLGHKENNEIIRSELSQTEEETEMIKFVLKPKYKNISDLLHDYHREEELINKYFENHMINYDDEAIKCNRLTMMAIASSRVLQLVDPRKIITKF